MYDVFISHAPEDADVAHMLADQLQLRGNSVWWQRPLSPDIAFITEHEQNLATAKWVIALWSRHSLRSEWVLFEAHEARSRSNLISIRLDKEPIPEEFSDANMPELQAFQRQLDHLIGTSRQHTMSPDLGQLQKQFSTPASDQMDAPQPPAADWPDFELESPLEGQLQAASVSPPGDGYSNGQNNAALMVDQTTPANNPDSGDFAAFEETIDHHGVSSGFRSEEWSGQGAGPEQRFSSTGLIAGLAFLALAAVGGYYSLSAPAPSGQLSTDGPPTITPDRNTASTKTRTTGLEPAGPAPPKPTVAVTSKPIQSAEPINVPARPEAKNPRPQIAPKVLAAGPDVAEPLQSTEKRVQPTQEDENAGVSSDFVEDDGDELVMLNETGGKTPAQQTAAIAGDAQRGKKFIRKCKACHTLKKNGGNKMGPNLYNVLGRGVGAYPGFAYSNALKNRGGAWSRDLLDCYLGNPKRCIKGTTMAFAGLRNAQVRADVIAYLQNLNK